MAVSIDTRVLADGVVLVTLRGEIEHYNAAALYEAVRGALSRWYPRTIKIDLGLVSFMDSAAIGALVGAYKIAESGGARLVVQNPSPFAHRQLRVAGVADMLGVPPAEHGDSPVR